MDALERILHGCEFISKIDAPLHGSDNTVFVFQSNYGDVKTKPKKRAKKQLIGTGHSLLPRTSTSPVMASMMEDLLIQFLTIFACNVLLIDVAHDFGFIFFCVRFTSVGRR